MAVTESTSSEGMVLIEEMIVRHADSGADQPDY